MDCANRIIFTALLMLLPASSFAGGDAVAGRVQSIEKRANSYLIHFIQTDTYPALIDGCREMTVTVTYSPVPWFSRLPFIKSSHPTKKETIEAIEYLMKANKDNEPVYFGYMGYGLFPTGTKCSFTSKGLKKIIEDNKLFIVSCHHET